MPRLTLHLLGTLSATLNERGPVTFGYDKVRALLGYLAVEHDRVHPRSRLAALFWPEFSESAARHSLSQALSSLRTSLEDRSQDSPLLIVDRQGVRFDVGADCTVDLLTFNRLLGSGDERAVADDHIQSATQQQLREAVDLYRGPLLEGLSLDDCPEFEDWQRNVQEVTERRYAAALKSLINQLEDTGNLDAACTYSRRLVELDPWEEANQRTLMRLLAVSGQRNAALRQFELCRAVIDEGLGAEPEPETVKLADRIRAGMERPPGVGSYTPAAQRSAAATLPAPLAPVVGRESEVADIAAMLGEGETRLITLIGPGGIGKSSLALEVARTLEPEVPDGVFSVSLAGLQSAELLASTILDAVGAPIDPQSDPGQQLIAYLKPRQTLLLLDNFEHLLDGALLVRDLLEHVPGLQVLVTSRQRLALTCESVYEVDGLSLPSGPESHEIAVSGSTRLFMIRARKHKMSFLPREEDGPALVRIAHLTGGMPLALELAAAWIPVLSPDEIADEIEQSVDFLSAGMQDLPERHRSVRAVVDRSWENLSGVEQRTFRRLSVFQGGFTRAAAGYVAGASLPVLSALVSKSLLRHSSNGRYEIHELLRQYAADRLSDRALEADLVRDRYRDYYIGFVAVREEQLQTSAQIRVLNEFASEMDNIRSAWSRAIETVDIQGLARAANCLWLYFDMTDRYSEGSAMMREGYQALNVPNDRLRVSQAQHDFARARLLSREAALVFRLAGPGMFLEQLNRALEMIRPLDAPDELGLLLNFAACAAHVQGEDCQEECFLIESIEQFELAGNRWGIAYSRNDLGQLLIRRGDYAAARELNQSALAILEEYGDQRGIAFALRNLGIVERYIGNPDRALRLFRRSVDIRRPLGNQWGTAESLNQIGILLRETGDPDGAAEHFREALQIARDIRAMQLAAEILREYAPLLPGDHETASVATRPISAGNVLSDIEVAEISGLVDSILNVESSGLVGISGAAE